MKTPGASHQITSLNYEFHSLFTNLRVSNENTFPATSGDPVIS